MMYKYLVTVTLFLALTSADIEDDLDYYEQFIRENLVAEASYVPPATYRGFQLNDENAPPIDFGVYDFIIAGGGTAGSLLARRLSEVQSWNVLVIEAGGRGNNFTDIPAVNMGSWSSDYNWAFNSTPQRMECPATASPFRQMSLPRGRAIGGSSVINGNVFSRGSQSDYDRWGARGLPNWSYENVLPFFKKYENASRLKGIDPEVHGFDGPFIVENYHNTSELSETFIQSMISLGYNLVDYNGRNVIGIGHVQKSTRNGRRNSGDNAFIRPIDNRRNLRLQINSLATKVLLEGNRATGVEFINRNRRYVARARFEVILSSGAYQSAQLLMLSGIGPSSELSRHNIPVQLELPVGRNYIDHFSFGVSCTTNLTAKNLTVREALAQYLRGVGPLTISTGTETVAFCNTSYTPVEYVTMVTKTISLVNDSLTFGTQRTTDFTAYLMLLHPKSIGSIQLKSRDPLQYPLLNPNYLQHEDDLAALVEASQLLVKIYENDQFKKYNLSIVRDSSCSSFPFNSDDYWRCVIRCTGYPGNHPCGTCRMGVSPNDSVVNERLVVHGMRNLRVADAGIIPVSLTGHMFATAYMIGEKAAHLIKEDHGIL
ncbi:glucose dehydrogenase [FAD, quinone]-like [Agrilus planipennis]|uniref:Glucose dehydrogenase [FAD, quinone]-like n=1 Tax=Agrilus planipennis TaxID=224129 RepID=A0A1W4XLA2_AGRPL|nr:glucose dehydrogenase [FAD, quinone]-like [Agrilus planipennis]